MKKNDSSALSRSLLSVSRLKAGKTLFLLLGVIALGKNLWATDAVRNGARSTAVVPVTASRQNRQRPLPPEVLRSLLRARPSLAFTRGRIPTIPRSTAAQLFAAQPEVSVSRDIHNAVDGLHSENGGPTLYEEFGPESRIPTQRDHEKEEAQAREADRQETASREQKLHDVIHMIATDTIPTGEGDATAEDGHARQLIDAFNRGTMNREFYKEADRAVHRYLSHLPEPQRAAALANIQKYFPAYKVKPVAPGRFDGIGTFLNNVSKPLPRLAYTAADALLERNFAHSDAAVLSQTDPNKMRWTNDGRMARAAAFGLRKVFALKDVAKTLGTQPGAPFGRAFQQPTWGRSAAFARLLGLASNFMYQWWTRKRAQLSDEELKELATYNHYVGLSDDIKALQNAIKSNADWRAGVHVASDGILGQISHPTVGPLSHSTGLWHEFKDIRHRARVVDAYDKVRARIKEWREENPDLQLPTDAAGQPEGMQELMQMLMGGMGGQGGAPGHGGMDPQQLQQLLAGLG